MRIDFPISDRFPVDLVMVENIMYEEDIVAETDTPDDVEYIPDPDKIRGFVMTALTKWSLDEIKARAYHKVFKRSGHIAVHCEIWRKIEH